MLAKLDRANFDGLHMAPRLADAIRDRPDRCPVLWKDVRAVLFEQTRKLNTPDTLRRLHGSMVDMVASLTGRETDLTWLAERAISETLIPHIVGGLSPRDHGILVRDQHTKIENVLTPFEQLLRGPSRLFPVLRRLRNARHEAAAGRIIARELRRRMAGTRPPQDDYAQAVLALVDRLGVERATYAVTTLLTAVAGAPGTVGACLLYEYVRRPEWRARIREEYDSIPEDELFREPVKSAPVAYRFVKEAMRFWSFPLLAKRVVYRDFEVDDFSMKRGDAYFLSSYLVHRDAEYWEDPEAFDPDRWQRSDRPVVPGAYAPFGWGGRTCVGASFGLSQTMMFLQIVSSRFDIECTSEDRATVALDGIAAPEDFYGVVTSRPPSFACPAHKAA